MLCDALHLGLGYEGIILGVALEQKRCKFGLSTRILKLLLVEGFAWLLRLSRERSLVPNFYPRT